MAKIELAYSIELNAVMDPIEANELWIEGVLEDKRAFVCTGENCNAGITCKNMDSYPESRKMIPHFIMSSRENEHDSLCDMLKEFDRIEMRKKESKEINKLRTISKKICFHIERPENHRKIVNVVIEKENSGEELKEKKKRAKEKRESNNSNFYWLNSLIWYYVDAYRENRINSERIEIDFGKGRKYSCNLAHLFKRIEQEKYEDEKSHYHYVYFGRAKIFARNDDGYDVVFSENFCDSKKKVKCVINKGIIAKCEHGKKNKLSFLEKNIGKETFVYVLSSKNENDSCIFLNVLNLDCIAISEVDLGCLEEKI